MEIQFCYFSDVFFPAMLYPWKILEMKLSLFPTVCKKLREREKKKEDILFKERERLQCQNQKFLHLNNKNAKIKTIRAKEGSNFLLSSLIFCL